MVTRGHAHHAFSSGRLLIFLIMLHKYGNVPFSFFIEKRMLCPEQIHITGIAEMQEKIHMKACLQRYLRPAPFRYQDCFRELPIQKRPYLLPQPDGFRLVIIIFHQRTGHIHSEAVTAQAQPEAHDIHQLLPGSPRPRRVHRLLPRWIIYPGKAVI